MNLKEYDLGGFYDEMLTPEGTPRPHAAPLLKKLAELPPEELRTRQEAAERALLYSGVTFTVYGDGSGTERIFPFDIIPRIVAADEWERIEAGLKQRIRTLNHFIDDIYHEQRILKDGVVPKDIVLSSKVFRPQCVGFNPPRGVWCHITGTDLVRHSDGEIYVLEDNLRCPSGVSYVLENRRIMRSLFPQIFGEQRIRPVSAYPSRLREMLEWLAPEAVRSPHAALLTPGIYNSAYFEHSFLAQQMGIELVEGSDLVVHDDAVFVRTTRGFERVDVIYRRIDDDFLDPEVFRPDSLIGVPGLMRAYQKGRVALVNAPGTGVADDKVVYAYVPRMVRYYLDEEPILPNVPTYICAEPDGLAYTLENIEKLVVKAANEAGGYGMLVGPQATREQHAEFREKIKAHPRNYIAQPTLSLSRVPTLINGRLEGRHVDLRPYILYGEEIYVLPGGLTRVALRKGSLVVNSSQGGGSKDTWVLAKVPLGSQRPPDEPIEAEVSAQAKETPVDRIEPPRSAGAAGADDAAIKTAEAEAMAAQQ